MQPERMTGRVRRSGFVDLLDSKDANDAGKIEGKAEGGGRPARGQARREEGQRAERGLEIDVRVDDRGTARRLRLDQAQGQARTRGVTRQALPPRPRGRGGPG